MHVSPDEIVYTRVVNIAVVGCRPRVPGYYCVSIPRRKPVDMILIGEMLNGDWKEIKVVVAVELQQHGRFFFDVFLKLCDVGSDPRNTKFKKETFEPYREAVDEIRKIINYICGYIFGDNDNNINDDRDALTQSLSFLRFSFYASWSLVQSGEIARRQEEVWMMQVKELLGPLGYGSSMFQSWSSALETVSRSVKEAALTQSDQTVPTHFFVDNAQLINAMVSSFYGMLIKFHEKNYV